MDKLFTFTDDELLEELANRNDAMVFVGKKLTTIDGEKCQKQRFYHGDKDICLGLSMQMSDMIIKEIWDEEV